MRLAAVMELDERMPKKCEPDATPPPRLPHSERADPAAALAFRIAACDRRDLVALAHDEPEGGIGAGRIEPLALPVLEGRLMESPLVLEGFAEGVVERPRLLRAEG